MAGMEEDIVPTLWRKLLVLQVEHKRKNANKKGRLSSGRAYGRNSTWRFEPIFSKFKSRITSKTALSRLSHHDKSSKTQPPWCHCGLSIITKTTLYHAGLFWYCAEKPICRSRSKKSRMVRLIQRENSDAHDITEIRRCNWCCGLMPSIMIVTTIYDAAPVNQSFLYTHKEATGSW